MNSDGFDLQAWKRIAQNTRGMLSYLDKRTGRMHQKMLPDDDPREGRG